MAVKLAVITSTRAEYGLLSPLIHALMADEYFQVQIVVTGTHLLKRYGYTVDEIRRENVVPAYEIPIMEETSDDVNRTIAKGIIEFAKVYEKEKFDAIIVLGDRYELYSFCVPAIMLNIPVIHIHGGELTEGAVDEKIRHSITKMAAVHFPTLPEYARRIIQMGENPAYVHSVGALGIDNIMKLIPIEKMVLEDDLGIDLGKPTALMTFHPVTLDGVEQAKVQGIELFEALIETRLQYVVTMPNSDMGSTVLHRIIAKYVSMHPEKFIYRKSLGSRKYLSLLRYVKMVVGNSSSGLIEVPSFQIPTIDIGDRQKGRYAPATVIHCKCKKANILAAIQKGSCPEFLDSLKSYKSPYGTGDTAQRIVNILKNIDFKSEKLMKKEFFDVKYTF